MRLLAYALVIFAILVPQASAQAQPTTEPAQAEAPAQTQGLDALIDIIEADPAGAALLARVRANALAEVERSSADETSDTTIAQQVAEFTRGAAEGVSASVQSVGDVVDDVARGLSGTGSDQLRSVTFDIVRVGATIFGVLLLLKLPAAWLSGKAAHQRDGARWLRKATSLLAAVVIDLIPVILAWAAGYLVAMLIANGGSGRLGINQPLLLNAFLFVELLKVGMRAVLMPRHSAIRILPMGDTSANYWSFWLSRVLSLVGYTFLFVVPILATNVSVVLASSVEVLVVATLTTIGILVVLQNKDQVRALLSAVVDKNRREGLAQIILPLARYWHILAITYLGALFVAWLANPAQALPFIVAATLQTIVAVVVALLAVGFIARFVNAGLRLPSDVKERLPLLERRLHAFVPKVLQTVRIIALAAVLLTAAQAWSLFDFVGWISSEAGQHTAGSIISALAVILIGFAIHVATSSWVEYRLNPNYGTIPTAREKTLLSLFKNAMTITLVVFVSMLALAQIGVNIAPLLAGAGVLGLAIGFGAQKFVQDIITGAFIQLENVMNEGDVVEAGGKSGVVERLTIRSVSIRDLSGTLHLIPFSSVDQVSNSNKDFAYHLAEIRVAYDTDIGVAKQAIEDAYDLLMETEHRDHVLGPLEMHGITAFLESAVVVRARVKTLPGSQWAAGRAFNEFVKQVFDQRGIVIPFPQVTMHTSKSQDPVGSVRNSAVLT
ncbi:small conductance mechanosensitive channel [Devosia lucknowensis]|uniref:Small conductance mechanosensitive channel n=1 Tax=Devosia lucknowensis TaxID=1096929 RepID=A0A1Y6ECJ9_9HYPH|nr:mechanosensitive ion channel domain-containing protein [Devosia lucknowensis]SMQ60169.1 small conductance mechanosensitive channel [Devosia lucknowensis]